MVFKVGLNFDGNQIVTYLHRKVCHRFEPDANRRRKLIAMAKECAARLCVGDWNVLLWDPEFITMDILEILAASKECRTLEGATQVAWLLGGNDIVLRKVAKHFTESTIDTDIDVPKVTFEDLKRKRKFLAAAIGKWSGASVLEVFSEKFRCNPLQEHLIPSESLTPEIQNEWENALDYLKNLNRENGEILSSQDHFEGAIHDVEYTVRAIFFASLIVRFGMSYFAGGFDVDGDWYLRIFRVNCYVREYIQFLLQFLQSKTGVGKRTNFARMRRIHISNCPPPPPGKKTWDVFTTSLESRKNVQVDGYWEWPLSLDCLSMGSPVSMPNVDLLDIMRKTLGGQESDVANVQESILDNLLGAKEVRKDTLQGRISRRKVHLLRCGEDCALVLPYLNKIVLRLNDDRWIRDHDVEALQPCSGEYNEGSIRRAATVLLGFDYPKAGEPDINDSAYRVLYQHARRGELYSKHLRTQLLSLKEIRHRVDIRALETRARKVFDDNEVMVAALVREMIHDVLLTKSDFSAGRILEHNKGYEKDVYFDTFYIRGGIAALNNVRWWSGVSMLGLSVKQQASIAAELNGEEMHGVPVQRKNSCEITVIWTPARKSRELDKEVTKGFIEDPNCLDATVLELLPPFAVPENGNSLGDFKVGGYCRTDSKLNIGAPPEKKRKRLVPSEIVGVEEITPMLDVLEVSNVRE